MRGVRSAIVFFFLLFTIIPTARSQWTRAISPYGAFVPALVSHGPDLFAGTGDGVYVSSDGGASWFSSADGLTSRLITTLASTDSMLFAGTYDSGVFQSTDRGAHWLPVNDGLANLRINAFLVSGRELFAATRTGLYRSTDDGSSWVKADSGLPKQKALVTSLAVRDSVVFAGIPGYGVFRSRDAGESWAPANNGLPPYARVACLAVIGGYLLAGTDTSGIFRSKDDGESWSASVTEPGNLQVFSFAVNSATGNTRGTRRPSLLAGTLGGVYVSSDSGNTWSAASGGLPEKSPVMSVLITDSSLIAGTDMQGIFVTTDRGARWAASNKGLLNTYFDFLYGHQIDNKGLATQRFTAP